MDTEELFLVGAAALFGIFILPKFFAAGESAPLTSGIGYDPMNLGAPVPTSGQPPTGSIRGLDGTQKTASLAEHFGGVVAGGPVGIAGEIVGRLGKSLGGNSTIGSKLGDYATVKNTTVKSILGRADSGIDGLSISQLAEGKVVTDKFGQSAYVIGSGDPKTGKATITRDHRAATINHFAAVSKTSDTAAQRGPFSR